MTKSRATRRFALGLAFAASMGASGCEGLLDGLQQRSTMVHVFATHHGTPKDGTIPDLGADGQHRTFETDDGWTVTLVEGYVTTTGVTLHHCDGSQESLDLFRDLVVEDIRSADLSLSSVGGLQVSSSEFCGMTVHYGPYQGDPDAKAPVYEGATIFLKGFAMRGEEGFPFEIRANAAIDVELDLSRVKDGGPLRVTGDENFPVELTIVKTYDQFFDAIDFTDMAQLDMAEHVSAVLEGVTRVAPGTRVAAL